MGEWCDSGRHVFTVTMRRLFLAAQPDGQQLMTSGQCINGHGLSDQLAIKVNKTDHSMLSCVREGRKGLPQGSRLAPVLIVKMSQMTSSFLYDI